MTTFCLWAKSSREAVYLGLATLHTRLCSLSSVSNNNYEHYCRNDNSIPCNAGFFLKERHLPRRIPSITLELFELVRKTSRFSSSLKLINPRVENFSFKSRKQFKLLPQIRSSVIGSSAEVSIVQLFVYPGVEPWLITLALHAPSLRKRPIWNSKKTFPSE